jgi:hypothetical protein
MKVFITAHHGENRYRLTFHKKAHCYQLSNGAEEVDVRDLPTYAVPCRSCFKDYVKPESVHRKCDICRPGKSAVPCEHNGGVLVYRKKIHRAPTWLSEAGEEYVQPCYVWPEHASKYLVTT